MEEEKTNLSLQSQQIIKDSKKTKSDITKQEKEKNKERLQKYEEKLRPLLEEKKRKTANFLLVKRNLKTFKQTTQGCLRLNS